MQCKVIGMWGGFPKETPCSGYLITHDKKSVLIDCGSGVLTSIQKFIDLNNIHDVILSHYHYDHYSDIGVYMFSRLVNTKLKRVDLPLNIYGPENPDFEKQVGEIEFSKFNVYDENTIIQIGDFNISFLKNIHPIVSYSIKIECNKKTLVYTSDTNYNEELVSFAKDADILIAECSLYEGMDGKEAGHMNATDAGILAYKTNAKQVILTHLPHYGNLEDLLESAKSQGNLNIKLAEAGMVIE